MQKVIRNVWATGAEGVEFAVVLRHDVHPEGLDVIRLRSPGEGIFRTDPAVPHVLTVLRGFCTLRVRGPGVEETLHLGRGTHAYLPPGLLGEVTCSPGCQLIRISGASATQARGPSLLVRDEAFVAACADHAGLLRWVLTPQYLSRRVFLHHDRALGSKSGHPVSWFHTTMFDVAGLPPNEQGEPVFKMSYNTRTELNVCFDVVGDSRVRFAQHPYAAHAQAWGPWQPVDGESSYHLNEGAGCPEEEWVSQPDGTRLSFRNKHEVSISEGHVTLYCMFDPAPTGAEQHRPGEYSDYTPIAAVLGTERHREILERHVALDGMVDVLSLAKARGDLDANSRSPEWAIYERGLEAQARLEETLNQSLRAQGLGRERIVSAWAVKPSVR